MKEVKISIFGDIMVEYPFYEQALTPEGADFMPSFAPLRELTEDSDLVIGNLETPLAGEKAGYVQDIVSFNSPDSLAGVLKDVGFDFLATANNHSLDRGYEGLCRTLDVLDSLNIGHTGTCKDPVNDDTVFYTEVRGLKIAVINYTYGVNTDIVGWDLKGKENCLNLLMRHDAPSRIRSMPCRSTDISLDDVESFIAGIAGREITWLEEQTLKKLLHMSTVIIDDVVYADELEPSLVKIEKDIRRAKEKADLVIFYPHMGGQFNTIPGSYSLYVTSRAVNAGADAVLAAHSHTTKKGEMKGIIPCFYSLGNVSMYPAGDYVDMESLPQYGMAVHLYCADKKIAKITFSIFKMLLDPDGKETVVPVSTLYNDLPEGRERSELFAETAEVYRRITGKEMERMEKEHIFFEA